MEPRLGDRIKRCCSGLERRMAEAEQCSEERLITLEMARAKSEQGHATLEK
jgi:hypothetical protein